MAFSAKSVANFFLKLAERDNIPISPLKLQKLVYIAHGWHLALFDQPLLTERVEAWPYGPVISNIYHQFKRYGNQPIDSYATYPTLFGQETVPDPDEPVALALIEKVWDVYKRFSAVQLSNMTHEPGTPWDITMQAAKHWGVQGEIIDDNFSTSKFADWAW